MPNLDETPPVSDDEDMTVAALARPIGAFVRTEMTADELAIFLLDRRLSCVAVVDDAEQVVGFVSMTDLVREHVMEGNTHDEIAPQRRRAGARIKKGSGFHEEPRHTRVGDMMMPFVLTLPERSTIPQAAAVMAARGVHRLLLLSSVGEAIGMVHALDVLRWFARRHGVYVPDDPEQMWRRACESALSPQETIFSPRR